MKIDFNPHAAAQAQNARGPQTQTTPPAPEGTDDGVTITLSQTAQNILKNGDADYDGDSPAHQARAAMLNAMNGETVDGLTEDDLSKPFGQIVKMFAHAKQEPETTEVAPPEDGGDVGEVTEPSEGGDTTATDGTDGTDDTGTTDGGDTTVADSTDGTGDTGTTEGGDTTVVAAPEEDDGISGTDSTIVVGEPDITEILDETAPAESDATEPDGGIADSGDAVAAVDTGDVTDELLDQLDENGEEVV